jgi:hypothetical protein
MSERAGAGEESTLLPPHAVKRRLRNKSLLSVQTKKKEGFLMIISPVDRSNCCTNKYLCDSLRVNCSCAFQCWTVLIGKSVKTSASSVIDGHGKRIT